MADALRPVSIGELRSYVQFATVADTIDPITGLSVKQYTRVGEAFAAIRPLGTQMFWENYNVEIGITHTVYTRYRSDMGSYQYIIQQVILPDTQDTQDLYYEILRASEWNAKRVYSRFDVRLLTRSF